MEFKVNGKEFEKILNKVIPAVPSRTPMAVLENFLIDISDGFLTIYATDLEIALRSSLKVSADKNHKFLVSAKLLYDTVRSLGDTSITFKLEDNGKLTLQTDNGEYKLSYLPSEEFPSIPSFPAEEEISETTLNGLELKKAFDISSFAMSKEDMRPAMTGTLLEFCEEGLRFVATDGHRLVNYLKKNVSGPAEEKYIIPERAVSVLQKILDEKDVKVKLSKTHTSFNLGELEFITRLIGQKYPDYQSVIPFENENLLSVNGDQLITAIKRMLIFSPSSSRKVKFSIGENNLEISAEDIDQGSSAKENLLCEYNSDSLEIGFNSQYVNDVITHLMAGIEGDDIIFKLHSATKAVIVVPAKQKEDEEILMLLMPVRLNN